MGGTDRSVGAESFEYGHRATWAQVTSAGSFSGASRKELVFYVWHKVNLRFQTAACHVWKQSPHDIFIFIFVFILIRSPRGQFGKSYPRFFKILKPVQRRRRRRRRRRKQREKGSVFALRNRWSRTKERKKQTNKNKTTQRKKKPRN